MKKSSPVFPNNENGRGNAVLGYDTKDDFSKFLEEARNHANDVILNSAKPSLDSVEKKITVASKKSWKNSLFFWWNPGKKSNADDDRSLKKKKNNNNNSASGSLSHAGNGGQGLRMSRPKSGPLSSCFTPTRAEQTDDVPYMCLEQQDYPPRVHNHRPIYKVT